MAARAITSQTVSNPLNIQYFSMTPHLFGDAACKFSIRPAGPPFPFQDRSAPNFLHDNLVKSLEEADAVFDFLVQLRKSPAMPVEDPTIKWAEADSAFVSVARIVIPRQSFDAPDRLALGEALSFTPWHGLDAHRPLGGINRVRRVVYETISALRTRSTERHARSRPHLPARHPRRRRCFRPNHRRRHCPPAFSTDWAA